MIPAGCWSSAPTPTRRTTTRTSRRAEPVILYCASGGRAALSGQALKEMGYDEVYNLGGFGEWAESGGAVEKP